MTQVTNFQNVSMMNEAFGNPKGDPYLFSDLTIPPNVIVPKNMEHLSQAADAAWAKLAKQCANIAGTDLPHLRGEAQELLQAIGGRHTDAVRDALCDIMVFAYGALHLMGVDADADMHEVVQCVMTRFCQDPQQLAETRAYFDSIKIEYVVHGVFPQVYLKSSKDQGDGEYPKGKFLKSVGYRQPSFNTLPPVPITRLVDYYTPAAVKDQQTTDALAALSKKFAGEPTIAIDEGCVDPVAVMALEREAKLKSDAAKRERIDAQVAEYRGKLEAEAFGLPAYDAKLGR